MSSAETIPSVSAPLIDEVDALLLSPKAEVTRWHRNDRVAESTAYGNVYRDVAETDDGQIYPVVIGKTADRRSDITIGQTTAWWTHTDGHNFHDLLRYMAHGRDVVLVGSEGTNHGSYRGELGKMMQCLGDISLTRSARNFHAVMDAVTYARPVQTRRMYLTGKSRGSMVGMGVLNRSVMLQHDRTFVGADLKAPCFPVKFDFEHVPELAKQIVSEPQHLAAWIAKLTLKHLVHYPSTLDIQWQSILFQLATGPALFSGEAGELARDIDYDQKIDLTTYQGDFASMPAYWDEIFAQHRNYRHRHHPGAHLSLASDKTFAEIIRGILETDLVSEDTDEFVLSA